MIETTVPEINVAELMERVRAESKRALFAARARSSGSNGAGPALPPVTMLPSGPDIWVPTPVKSNKERVDQLLERARVQNEGSSRIPKFLRRFFRKQGGLNRTILDSVAAVAKTNHDVARRIADISVVLGQVHGWLQALHEQSDADANWMKAATPQLSRVAMLEADLDRLAGHAESARTELEATLTGKLDDLGAKLAIAETGRGELSRQMNDVSRELRENGTQIADARDRVAEMDGLRRRIEQTRTEIEAHHLDDLGVHLRHLQAQADISTQTLGAMKEELAKFSRDAKLDSLQQQVDREGLHLRNLQAQTDRLGVHINNLQGFVDRTAGETNAIHRGFEKRLDDQAGLEKKLTSFEERAVTDAALLKGQLSEYGSLLRGLLRGDLEGAQAASRKKTDTAKIADPKTQGGLDSLYVGFENRFRGPRKEIKKRVEFYLPFVRKAGAGTTARPILDVGCGRGEWMELLKDHKLDARGVDLNSAMASQCKARGLAVEHADAIEYLQSLRANSHGAVTGFHIIEHLPFETLLELFSQARRILKPGGVAIFESPNCKNLMVGACNFYIDPTHRNPVFPETAEFILASQGFEKIRIEYLSPVPNHFHASSAELATLRDLLYGPQDFGVIAYKPKGR